MSDTQFTIGQRLKFVGYSETPDDPAFQPGQTVEVSKLDKDGNPMVFGIDENGNRAADGVVEVLFPEEVEVISETAEEAAEVLAEAPAPKAKKAKSTKAKAEPAPVEPVAEAEEVEAVEAVKADEDGGPRSDLVRAALSSVVTTENENEADAALKAARFLVDQVEKTYYTLGGVLAFIKETGAYKALGYEGKRGFADYCEKELETQNRKAQYLIEVYQIAQAAGLDEARLTAIGWSKAKEIIRVGKDISLDKLASDFEALADFADNNTRDQLSSHIKTSYEGINTRAAASTETVQVSSFVFKLSADQAATAENALATAKRLAGSEDLNVAFAYVLNDWLMMTEGTDITLDTAISVIEHRFGVTLTQAPAADVEDEVETGRTLEVGA